MAAQKQRIVQEQVDDESIGLRQTVRNENSADIAERVIWFVDSVVVLLLIIRFLFRLLGANPSNGIADFVYSVTHPLVAPFFGLFSYSESLGHGRFEYETLVATGIYILVAWLLAQLVTIGRRSA